MVLCRNAFKLHSLTIGIGRKHGRQTTPRGSLGYPSIFGPLCKSHSPTVVKWAQAPFINCQFSAARCLRCCTHTRTGQQVDVHRPNNPKYQPPVAIPGGHHQMQPHPSPDRKSPSQWPRTGSAQSTALRVRVPSLKIRHQTTEWPHPWAESCVPPWNLWSTTQKGASSWLTALPVGEFGFALNKRGFKMCKRAGRLKRRQTNEDGRAWYTSSERWKGTPLFQMRRCHWRTWRVPSAMMFLTSL